MLLDMSTLRRCWGPGADVGKDRRVNSHEMPIVTMVRWSPRWPSKTCVPLWLPYEASSYVTPSGVPMLHYEENPHLLGSRTLFRNTRPSESDDEVNEDADTPPDAASKGVAPRTLGQVPGVDWVHHNAW